MRLAPVMAHIVLGMCAALYVCSASTAASQQSPGTVTETFAGEFDRALAILRSGDNAAFARYIRNHIQGQDLYCGAITDFQVVDRGAKRLTIKARCLGMPLYGLVFAPEKKVQIFGGDGMVSVFSNADGAITRVPLVSAQDRTEIVTAAGAANEGPSEEFTNGNGLSWWLVLSIALNFIVVSGLLVFALYSLRRAEPIPAGTTQGLSTADKNALIGQSVEILRCIHRHPSGVYIVKGRHGKRRLFRTIFFAVLYRDYGVKLREIA